MTKWINLLILCRGRERERKGEEKAGGFNERYYS
jgi:hypothetical protein